MQKVGEKEASLQTSLGRIISHSRFRHSLEASRKIIFLRKRGLWLITIVLDNSESEKMRRLESSLFDGGAFDEAVVLPLWDDIVDKTTFFDYFQLKGFGFPKALMQYFETYDPSSQLFVGTEMIIDDTNPKTSRFFEILGQIEPKANPSTKHLDTLRVDFSL